MSTNGEGESNISRDDNKYVSPNITSATGESLVISNEPPEKLEQDVEKVDVDGIPIDEKDIEFRAKNIKKKNDGELFVNVEGAEKRAREAERKRRQEDQRVIKELAEKARNKKESNKRHEREKASQEEAHAKNINRHKQQLKRDIAKQKRHEAREKRIEKFKAFLNLFWGGKRRYATIGVLSAIVVVVAVYALNVNVIEPAKYRALMETTASKQFTGTQTQADFDRIVGESADIAIEDGNSTRQLEYIQKQIDSAENQDLKKMLEIFYVSVDGSVKKTYDDAIEKILELEKKADKAFIKEYAYRTVASLCRAKGDFSKADEYYKESEKYSDVDDSEKKVTTDEKK